jgi:hypothetical protein
MITEEQRERVLKWIAALRSGKYKQTIHTLKGPSGYCCLGVACEISRLSTWDCGFYLDEGKELPNEVRLYYGLRKRNGGYLSGKKALSRDNDEGANFEKISNIIEKALDNPEMGMFV